MVAVQVQHYLGRARDFLDGMKYLQDDLDAFGYSSALLGIHGAISYSDALRVGMGNDSLSSDDHRQAVRDLRLLLSKRKYMDQKGVDKLDKLLGQTRAKIAYLPEAADEDEIKRIVQHAERFASWAENAGRKLQIEGW